MAGLAQRHLPRYSSARDGVEEFCKNPENSPIVEDDLFAFVRTASFLN